MSVKRIVANIAAEDLSCAQSFYGGVLGLRLVMDHGWIVTFAAEGAASPQISIATQGGSGTPVPDLSVEVDDLTEIHARVLAAACRSSTVPSMSPGASAASSSATPSAASSTSSPTTLEPPPDAPPPLRRTGPSDPISDRRGSDGRLSRQQVAATEERSHPSAPTSHDGFRDG